MPDQKLFDKFTNIDNILVNEMLPVLRRLQTGDINVQMSGETGEDTLQSLLDLAVKRYNDDNEIIFFSYPNDGTRAATDAGHTVLNFRHGTIKIPDGTVKKMSSSLQAQKKDHLRSIAINSDEDIIIQLDDKDRSPVRADTWHVMTFQQFQELTITTTAATTNLFCFACTNPKHAYEMAGETTISIGREERNQAKSLIGTHFTGAIAQHGAEEENIADLSSDEITITGVAIYSQQQLDLRLMLFETDGFQAGAAADMDDDGFVEFIDLDLVTSGIQYKNAGYYYYSITGLEIDYEDLDKTNELHAAIQVVGATAKLASGAGGNLWLKFSYIPRT